MPGQPAPHPRKGPCHHLWGPTPPADSPAKASRTWAAGISRADSSLIALMLPPFQIMAGGAEDPPHPPPRGLGLPAIEWTSKAHPGSEARARPKPWTRAKSLRVAPLMWVPLFACPSINSGFRARSRDSRPAGLILYHLERRMDLSLSREVRSETGLYDAFLLFPSVYF
jgi:hypothetical protein